AWSMLVATPTTTIPSRSRWSWAAPRKRGLSSTSRPRRGMLSGSQGGGGAASRLAGIGRYRVQVEPATGAFVEDLAERLAGDEPEHDRGLGGGPGVPGGRRTEPGGTAPSR